jgi:hypothetical protein
MEEKTYQEQAIAFVLKTVVTLGSVYLITEKFIVHINSLFNFESMESALLVFYLIYFVLPLAVVAGYFFLKKSSVQIFNGPTNIIMGIIAATYAVCMLLARWADVQYFIWTGYALIFITLVFLVLCWILKRSKEFRKQRMELFTLAFLILVFAFCYLTANINKSASIQTTYFSNDTIHFRMIEEVENYRLSTASKFKPGAAPALSDSLLRWYYYHTTDSAKIIDSLAARLGPSWKEKRSQASMKAFNKKVTNNHLIEWTRNCWGLYINIISFKALLVLLPFAAMILLFIFLFSTSHPNQEDKTWIVKKGDDFEVVKHTVHNPEEKRFLKMMLIILVTLTIPVLHPLETVKTQNLFPGFSGSKKIETSDSLKYIIHSHDTVTIIDSVYILPRDSGEISKIKKSLAKLNQNVVGFSQFFGDETMIDSLKKDTVSATRLLYFKPKKNPMINDIFKE